MRPKGFPASLVIVSQRWRVEYRSNLLREEQVYGKTIPTKRLILIDSTQDRECMADTLLHEVLHAAMHTQATGLTDEAEERVCGTLAPALLSVLRGNQRWW